MLYNRTSLPYVVSAAYRAILPASSLLVWGMVAFSVLSWGLRWSAPSSGNSAVTSAPQNLPEINTSAVARSLGAASVQPAAAPTLASRFQLQGVLAQPDSSVESTQGIALIAVDSKPAKPYRVGSVVAEGLVLQSAQGRRVRLGASVDGPQTLELELPVKK